MVTIYRSDGFNVVIYTNDHAPMHVHFIKGRQGQPGSGEAKINLVSPNGGPSLEWVQGGLSKSDVRKAMEIARENQAQFIVKWREIHG